MASVAGHGRTLGSPGLFHNGQPWRRSCDTVEQVSPPGLDDLATFLCVLDRGGFSAAARERHCTPGAVSKQIARLERHLAVRLFERTTRRLRLTSEGEAVAVHARDVLARLGQIAEVAARSRHELAGSIRLTAPAPFGRKFVAPAIAAFRQQHPAVDFELHLTDQVVDLVQSGFDLALRIGALVDSQLVARPLAKNHRILVASPDYLARHGSPAAPAELAAHSCLIFAYPGSLQSVWSLISGSQTARVAVRGGLRSDNGEVLRAWCQAGLGVSLRETWDVVDELHSGQLVRLLPTWQAEPGSIHAVRVHRDPVPQRLEAFLDFLAATWKSPPWEAPSAPLSAPALAFTSRPPKKRRASPRPSRPVTR